MLDYGTSVPSVVDPPFVLWEVSTAVTILASWWGDGVENGSNERGKRQAVVVLEDASFHLGPSE